MNGEVTESEICFHNSCFCNLYFAPSIIRVIGTRRVEWMGRITFMGVPLKCQEPQSKKHHSREGGIPHYMAAH